MGQYKNRLLACFVAALSLKLVGVNRYAVAQESEELVAAAIKAVRLAPDAPEDDSEENICRILLEKMNEKLLG